MVLLPWLEDNEYELQGTEKECRCYEEPDVFQRPIEEERVLAP